MYVSMRGLPQKSICDVKSRIEPGPFDSIMKQMVLRILHVLMPLKSQHFEEKERKKVQSALKSASMHFRGKLF